MEIESALVSHPYVAEAAVVGKPDELKGQAVVAFVTPKDSAGLKDFGKATTELKAHVAKEIGAIARPDEIRWTKTLPKTRSGKIMRRLLKDLAAGKEVTGDTTTLENPGLVEYLH
jgi:acetyl-CoA synthetase